MLTGCVREGKGLSRKISDSLFVTAELTSKYAYPRYWAAANGAAWGLRNCFKACVSNHRSTLQCKALRASYNPPKRGSKVRATL